MYSQALAISRRIGSRFAEAMDLICLGEAHRDLGLWDQAAGYCRQAGEVADAIDSMQAQSEARLSLARIQLLAGDVPAIWETIAAARDHDYPPGRAHLSLLSGIAYLKQNKPVVAAREFRDAIAHADNLLKQTSRTYKALAIKALALCGLVLTAE